MKPVIHYVVLVIGLLMPVAGLLGAVMMDPGIHPALALTPVLGFVAGLMLFASPTDRRRGAIRRWAVVCISLNVLALLFFTWLYGRSLGRTRRRRTELTVDRQRELLQAVQAYCDEFGAYPPVGNATADTTQLFVMLRRSRAAGRLLGGMSSTAFAGQALVDGYGRPVRYVWRGSNGEPPAIISAGKDGLFGTDDDIRTSIGERGSPGRGSEGR